MSELEEKLSSVLGNPQMMQQIMAMAQSLGAAAPQQDNPPPPPPQEGAAVGFDPKLLQVLSGIASKNTVDQNQQALLRALSPFISRNRVGKLEKAMRAARLADTASAFLNAGGLGLLTRR